MTESSRRPRDTLALGHRGASALAPENTVAAFERAAVDGADGVELDVRRTRDDHLVVVHDALLPDGRVLAEVDAVALPSSVAHLDEALAASPGWINVEAKELPHEPGHRPGDPVAVAAARHVVTGPHADRVWLSSFDPLSLAAVRAEVPAMTTGQLVLGAADVVALLHGIAASGHDAVHPHDPLVDPTFVVAAHGLGLEVHVWTVDDLGRVAELARWGVDGIIANDPGRVRRHLDAM